MSANCRYHWARISASASLASCFEQLGAALVLVRRALGRQFAQLVQLFHQLLGLLGGLAGLQIGPFGPAHGEEEGARLGIGHAVVANLRRVDQSPAVVDVRTSVPTVIACGLPSVSIMAATFS